MIPLEVGQVWKRDGVTRRITAIVSSSTLEKHETNERWRNMDGKTLDSWYHVTYQKLGKRNEWGAERRTWCVTFDAWVRKAELISLTTESE